jgi:predicted CXXCH cytochrome family protein
MAALLGACRKDQGPTQPTQEVLRKAPQKAALPGSNIARDDYAGSNTCVPCHAEIAATQTRSAMHDMTRDGQRAPSRAPWGTGRFSFKGSTAELLREGNARFVSLGSPGQAARLFRVTRIIGGRHREDYAGVPVSNFAQVPPSDAEEWILPVSYLLGPGTFRYKGYSVMVNERPGMMEGPKWNETCVFCHNTPPALSTMLGVLAGAHPAYQGAVVDELLPAGRKTRYQIIDDGALTTALNAELTFLGAPANAQGAQQGLAQLITETRRRFRGKHLEEQGITCESCHFGARMHVENPALPPSLGPKHPGLAVTRPADERNARVSDINRGCARCHQVLFSGYEWTWEGGHRRQGPGGSHINSGEGRDFLLGGCKTALSCTQCHDPHAERSAQKAKDHPEQMNALCTSCHARYAGAGLAAHTHHAPASAGSSCIECHMPRKNMALDGTLSRYHRIGSPTDADRVHLDRPLECALCHQDASVRTLVDAMERFWGKKYDRDILSKAYGSLDANALLATAQRGHPHEQAVAFQLLPSAKVQGSAQAIAPGLWGPRPLVRGYAKDALSKLAGVPCDIDTDAPREEIELRAAAFLREHKL